jgi:hypothetical protein
MIQLLALPSQLTQNGRSPDSWMVWWVSLLSSLVRLSTVASPTDLPYVFNRGYFIRSAYTLYGWPAQIKRGEMA